MTKAKTIDPEKEYSIAEIAKGSLIPGCKSFTAVKNRVVRDLTGPNVLKAKVLGQKQATRFYIKGANLIKFISR